MIVEYIRYRIPAEQAQEFIAGYEQAALSLNDSPHCLAYELSRCSEDESAFTLRIEWDSLDGHLHGFRRSQQFSYFFAAIKPFVDNIDEMRHYHRTSVARRKGEVLAS